jgi:arylsulfatase
VNDEPVGNGTTEQTVPMKFSGYGGMDTGCDTGRVVDLHYDDRKPFPFTGTINRVVLDVKPHLTQDDEAGVEQTRRHGATVNGVSA